MGGAVALDIDFVAGGVDGCKWLIGNNIHTDIQILDGLGGEFLRVEGVEVGERAGVPFKQLAVNDFHLFAAVRLYGVDAGLEHVAPGVFQKGGVAHLADDILVDLPGFAGFYQFRLCHRAIDLHAEFIDVGVLGDGEEVGAFETLAVGIVKLLVHGGGGDLAGDLTSTWCLLTSSGAKAYCPRGTSTGCWMTMNPPAKMRENERRMHAARSDESFVFMQDQTKMWRKCSRRGLKNGNPENRIALESRIHQGSRTILNIFKKTIVI